jgi:hypothetical protein
MTAKSKTAMRSLLALYKRAELEPFDLIHHVRADVDAYAALLGCSTDNAAAALDAAEKAASERWPRDPERAIDVLAKSIAAQPAIEERKRKDAAQYSARVDAATWDGSMGSLRSVVDRARAGRCDLVAFSPDCHVDARVLKSLLSQLPSDARAFVSVEGGHSEKLVITYGARGRFVLRSDTSAKRYKSATVVHVGCVVAPEPAPAVVAPEVVHVHVPAPVASQPVAQPVAAVRYVVLPPELEQAVAALEKKAEKPARTSTPRARKSTSTAPRGPRLAESSCPRCLDRARYIREQSVYRRAKSAARTADELAAAMALRPKMQLPAAQLDCARCEARYGKSASSKAQVAA